MRDISLAVPSPLEPGPLGTKEYWDTLYATELTNHALNATDEGTIWFDDSSAEDRVVAFLERQIIEEKVLGEDVGFKKCTFLDIGAGNGHLLLRLRQGENLEWEHDEFEEVERGRWEGRMMGVDYSDKSVEFARRLAEQKKLGKRSGNDEVEFQCWDIMKHDPRPIVLHGYCEGGYDVVLDKGTFDAISLSEEKTENGRRICERYIEKVLPLVREGGVFLVTSCNWTVEELNSWFEGNDLRFVDTIAYSSFSFGGGKGQTISSVCYRKMTP